MISWKLVIINVLFVGSLATYSRAAPQNVYEGKARQICFDRYKSIDELERYAELIVTGTVERLLPSPNDYDLYVAILRVRRVFKPWGARNSEPALTRVAVSNIGDSIVCRSAIKEKDTKIFMLASASERAASVYGGDPRVPGFADFSALPQYVLNSSVIALTLRNLDAVEAAVRGWPAKTRKPLKPEACERKLCAFGAVCKINGTTRRPYCDCVFNCENVFAPVCGTDNVTYTNECYLHASSCKTQRRIRVKLRSACDAKNPCDTVNCQFGSKCQVSVDGKSAHCVCPQKCYRYGDSQGSRPVCGDDGRNYESECHLQLESCRSNKEISIKYTGLCDPCANVTCPDATICRLNPMREPVCRCSEQCPLDYKPVCASDGRTYQNSCIMRIQECKMSRELRIVFNGQCEKGKNPCQGLKCEFGQECFIDPFGRATCECLHRCEPVVRPVCGKDKVTYDSVCELQRAACQKRTPNAVEHKGVCGVGACADHVCTVPGAICVLRKGKPDCQCPTCNDDFDPVCGSNGITYSNECKMRQEACEMKRVIFAKYRGFCTGCKNKNCENYAVCVSDDKGQATCRCPEYVDCPEIREPVCGTDGKTYDHLCHLKVESCRISQFIAVSTKGACSACSGIECPWKGRCEDGRCVCPKECPIAKPGGEVCGSDGLLYPSECHMQARACAKSMRMDTIERDRCSDEIVNVEQIGGVCECNRIGARSNECDKTGQCPCKPGVGGRKCDQCQPGFWGLQLISKGNAGCQPCGCSAFGSDRDDCEQTTGRCVCKPRVKSSMKCDQCDDGMTMRPRGCVELSALDQQASTCEEMQCYFGAKCLMQGGRPECVCPDHCAIPAPAYSGEEGKMEVCGSNGVTYGSACQLRQFACRLQIDVVVFSLGPCNQNIRKTWKPFKTTRDLVTARGQDGSQQRMLTTITPIPPHHQEGGEYGSGEEVYGDPGGESAESQNELGSSSDKETSVSSSLRLPKQKQQRSEGLVGDTCSTDSDCSQLENGFCVDHVGHKICLCRHGYVPSQNRSRCVAVSNQIEPCAQQPYPCQNGGSCVDDDNTQTGAGFRCICPRGYGGTKCEKKTEKSYLYAVPRFGGHSWMEFNRMDAYTDVTIEIELIIHDTDGLILYNGQKEHEKGDFISLALVGGFVEFRYNLGDGILIYKSKDRLKIDHWHKIVANRVGQRGRLIVDKSLPVTESTTSVGGSNTNLDLRRHMYLGKVPHTPKYVVQTVGTPDALNGCILSLKINGKIFDLRHTVSVDILKSHNVGECGVNPCSSLPCLNGGTCIQKSETDYACVCDQLFTGSSCETSADSCASQPCKYGGTCQPIASSAAPFTCLCHQGRTGTYCENDLPESTDTTTVVPEFHGSGYMEMRSLPSEAGRTLSIGIWLMPYKPDGLVMFAGNVNEMHGYGGGDFISLALVDGRVQFLFNLGSGVANITSRKVLDVRRWHSIKAYRHLRNATLEVDQEDVQMGESPPPWDKLNLDGLPVFVGGYRNSKLLKPLLGVETGFYGAIQRFSLNGLAEEKLMKAASFASGVGRYEGQPCHPNPCFNGGTCSAKLDQFECLCEMSFTGTRCEQEIGQADIEDDRAISFDGHTFLKFRNRVTNSMEGQQESNFVFRLRTNATDGLIVWENRGLTLRGDFLAIALVNGRVTASYNLGKESPQQLLEMRSKISVMDGDWHIVRFWRTKRQAYLSVDDEDPPEMILSSPGATELNTDGHIWIGGYSRLPAGLPRSYNVGFHGCLEGVSVDGHRLHMSRHHLKSSRHRLTACEA